MSNWLVGTSRTLAADAVLFLASPRASIITGQVLHANSGGLMA